MGGTGPALPPDPDPEPLPVTPQTAPTYNDDGHLTYIGDDGRRYVVAEPPD